MEKKKLIKIIVAVIIVIIALLLLLKSCGNSKVEYEVSFNNQDGTVLQTEMVKKGAKPEYKGEVPTYDDEAYTYTFTGWDKEVEKVTSNQVYTAVYSKAEKEYLIKFVNKDNSVLQESLVKYGEMPVYNGTTPKYSDSKYNYTFKGWDKELTNVTGETTYTAQYKTTSKNGLLDAAKIGAIVEFKLKSDSQEVLVKYERVKAGYEAKLIYTEDTDYTDLYKDIIKLDIDDNHLLFDFADDGILNVDLENMTYYKTLRLVEYNYKLVTFKVNQKEYIGSLKEIGYISMDLQHCTVDANAPKIVNKNGTTELIFTPQGGYDLPSSSPYFHVFGATVDSWNKDTGKLILSNPTGSVLITVNALAK